MSGPLERIQWAYAQEVTGPAKAVLAYLAYRDGKQCTPSIRTIAKDCGLARNTVKAALQTLECEGLVGRQERYANNRRLSDEYTLDYADRRARPPATRTRLVAQGLTHGGSGAAPPVGQELTRGGSAADPPVGQEVATEQEDQLEVNEKEKQELQREALTHGAREPVLDAQVDLSRDRPSADEFPGEEGPSVLLAGRTCDSQGAQDEAAWWVEAGMIYVEYGCDTGGDRDRLQRHFDAMCADSDLTTAAQAFGELVGRYPQDPQAALAQLGTLTEVPR